MKQQHNIIIFVANCRGVNNSMCIFVHTLCRNQIEDVGRHGGIDGFSRMVVYPGCSTNNRSLTIQTIEEYEVPSLCSKVEKTYWCASLRQHAVRGTDRGSHIAGSSVHNQRIERIYGVMYTGVSVLHTMNYSMQWKHQVFLILQVMKISLYYIVYFYQELTEAVRNFKEVGIFTQ